MRFDSPTSSLLYVTLTLSFLQQDHSPVQGNSRLSCQVPPTSTQHSACFLAGAHQLFPEGMQVLGELYTLLQERSFSLSLHILVHVLMESHLKVDSFTQHEIMYRLTHALNHATC